MAKLEFYAKSVVTQTDDGSAMLGFADDEFNTTQYVLLQRDLEPSQQDLNLGHDKPHIEINDQRHSGYGGVVEAQLQGNRLVLKLDAQAAADMSINDIIEIAFCVSTERLKDIAEQLCLLIGKDRVHEGDVG